MSPKDYNYAHFPRDLDGPLFAAFKAHLTAGERAPVGRLLDAHSGAPVALSGLWRAAPLVVEFGSLS